LRHNNGSGSEAARNRLRVLCGIQCGTEGFCCGNEYKVEGLYKLSE